MSLNSVHRLLSMREHSWNDLARKGLLIPLCCNSFLGDCCKLNRERFCLCVELATWSFLFSVVGCDFMLCSENRGFFLEVTCITVM